MTEKLRPQCRIPVRSRSTPSSRAQSQPARQTTAGSHLARAQSTSASQWWRPKLSSASLLWTPQLSSAQNSADAGGVNADAAPFTGTTISAEQPTIPRKTLQLDLYPSNSVSLRRRAASPAKVHNTSVILNPNVRASKGQMAGALNTVVTSPVPLGEMQRALATMKDAASVDFAFVFNLCGSGRLMALWANHTVLTKVSNQFQKLHRFSVPDWRDVTPSLWLHSVFVAWVLEDPLVPFCALIHYLYTGRLELEVDMRQFFLTDWPIQSLSQLREKRVNINELWAGPVKTASSLELCELAERYQLWDLCAACEKRV